MKQFLCIIVSLLIPLLIHNNSFSSDYSHKYIRVLILDERFPLQPSPEERLEKIGNIKGQLMVGGVSYRGNIEVYRGRGGLYLVNQLPLEDYVESVVASEVTESWEMEALKAQAVVVRTYALRHILKNPNALFHLTSSTLHQIYSGENKNRRIVYAVLNTKGEVLTYKGKLIEALYHSTCGGTTEKAKEVFGYDIPYLKSVENDCSISPYWRWKRVIEKKTIEKLLSEKDILDIEVSSYTPTGRVKDVTIITKRDQYMLPAKDFRRLLGWRLLPSTWFKVKQEKESFIFKGKGYGHGVGLCQWGAQQMAKKGRTYKEILKYYYPGTTIQRIK